MISKCRHFFTKKYHSATHSSRLNNNSCSYILLATTLHQHQLHSFSKYTLLHDHHQSQQHHQMASITPTSTPPSSSSPPPTSFIVSPPQSSFATVPPRRDAPLVDLLRWGDNYLSIHLNNNNNKKDGDEEDDFSSSFSDYHDESLQLLAHVLHLDYQTAKQQIYMQRTAASPLSQEQYEQFQYLIRQRAEKHVPLQYLIGTCHFYGREFIVNQNVLIPRPDSEVLIDATLHQVHHRMKDSVLRILDIGTGSGCLVTSLLCELRKERDHHATSAVALDNSYEALHVARQNATRLLPNMNSIFFVHQNILKLKDPAEALGSFNVIISNPPYIKTSVIPQLAPEVKDYEPRSALDGGEDGLIFYRHIIKLCDQPGGMLDDNGILALEIGYDQLHDVQQLIFSSQNLSILSVNKDLAGIDRAIVVLKSAAE